MDWGSRYALFKKWVGGYAQPQGITNPEHYRRWIPLLAAGVVTSFLAPPFEVAERAYIGDQTFPKELRVGYRSRFHALFKLLTSDPFALYKNSFPSILASFVVTTMALGSYDYLYELFHPLVYVADCPNWSVKGT
jgi:hypothetical protein